MALTLQTPFNVASPPCSLIYSTEVFKYCNICHFVACSFSNICNAIEVVPHFGDKRTKLFLGLNKLGRPNPRVSLSGGAPLHGITTAHLVPAALSSATPDLWTDPPTSLFSAPKYPCLEIAVIEKLAKLWQLWQPMIYGRTS